MADKGLEEIPESMFARRCARRSPRGLVVLRSLFLFFVQ